MHTPTRPPKGAAGSVSNAFGAVYTPGELAKLWKLSEQSVRRIFADMSGVFILGNTNPRGRRGYTTMRIPEVVALRVWQERSR